ncbi:peptide deformylase [Ligilactobacillus equi]|uniref:Peptide deformylase n=2 Tax=Ligilactobacillus equi TaxID=137357 RepID=V7HYB0_9LACO|nr:peptide deformylase [Ligilactobacillus equi]ETA74285.1 peptide deformylase [Ligilactobacillus equi DPC 6820]KRL75936.1 peptide deformylase [Ligilactobacillus equi DSM 15833 = JCM 10991]
MTVQAINRDQLFLSQKAAKATPADRQVIQDLKDTLAVHRQECVGMAANMIGVNKKIIIASIAPMLDLIMVNPRITAKSGAFNTMEGCLSLKGQRPTKRYHEITVEFLNENFEARVQTFKDWPAQIIQHELDHCQGIII